MPYLNLDLDYSTNVKTIRLVGICGVVAEFCPVRLWMHAGKHHVADGFLKGYSVAEVEAVAVWKGDPGALVAAMVKVGFLHEVKDGFQLHDWIDHEGHLVAFHARAKAGAKARWGRLADASSNASDDSRRAASNAPTKPSLPTEPTELKDEKIPAAPAAPRAPKPAKPKKAKPPAAPHWAELVKHMQDTWEEKRKKSGAMFYWNPKFWPRLRSMVSRYETYGVAALWENYLAIEDEWTHKTNWSFEMFETKLISLPEMPWKGRRDQLRNIWAGPIDSAVIDLMNGAIPNRSSIPRVA